MVARLAVAGWLATLAALLPRPAAAQDGARQHPILPLSELIPDALPAPPTAAEAGRGETPERPIVWRDGGGFTYDATGFRVEVDAEGRARIHDKSSFQGQLVVTPFFVAVAGTLDVTELVMRWLGEDPYQYEKARFLERTFEQRAAMRRRHSERVMDRALFELPGYLAAVWAETGWPIALRRRVLFALWDECAEDGNPLLVRGGGHARFLIEQFIRSRLGPASGQGYRPAELAELNRLRSSRRRFAPYDDPTEPPPPRRGDSRTAVAESAAARSGAPTHSGLAMRSPGDP